MKEDRFWIYFYHKNKYLMKGFWKVGKLSSRKISLMLCYRFYLKWTKRLFFQFGHVWTHCSANWCKSVDYCAFLNLAALVCSAAEGETTICNVHCRNGKILIAVSKDLFLNRRFSKNETQFIRNCRFFCSIGFLKKHCFLFKTFFISWVVTKSF